MSQALELNTNNFATEVLNNDLPVLVDFWASWCTPCQMMMPILEELAAELDGKIKIAKLNTEEESNQDLLAQYQVQNLPNMKLFKAGKIIKEFTGLRDKESLKAEIETLIK